MHKKIKFCLLGVAFLLTGSIHGEVFNGSFEKTCIKDPKSPEIQDLLTRKHWKLKEPIVWPVGWSVVTSAPGHPVSVEFEVVRNGAHSGKNYLKLRGRVGNRGIIWVDYSPLKPGGIYKASFFARGRGRAYLILNLYSKEGKYLGAVGVTGTDKLKREWKQYSGIFKNNRNAYLAKISLLSLGESYFDDIDMVPVDFWEARMVTEFNEMDKEGVLLSPGSPVDKKKYEENIETIKELLPKIKKFIDAYPIPEKVALLRKIEEAVEVMLSQEKSGISVEMFNKTLALRRICERLLKEVSFKDISE